jgi:glycerophosphoryl diester phosphodiesterase
MSAERLIAHRGHASLCPENTLSAVDSALQAGARAVEIDVQLSADREAFLMHDRTLERMCGVARSLGELRSAQVRELRASERGRFGERFAGERVASLGDFAAQIARAEGVHAYVELKRASIEDFGVDAVLDAVLPMLLPIRERCTLISFDIDVLRAARSRTDLPVGPVLIAWEQRTSPEIVSLAPAVVFCDHEKLPDETRGDFTLEVPGGALAVYEIGSVDVALALLRRGVRYLETFEVGRLLRELAAHGTEPR